MNSNDEGWSVS